LSFFPLAHFAPLTPRPGKLICGKESTQKKTEKPGCGEREKIKLKNNV